MSQVECTIWQLEYKKSKAGRYDETHVRCSKCGHSATSYGSGKVSVRRCLAILSAECPRRENNFYIAALDGKVEIVDQSSRKTSYATPRPEINKQFYTSYFDSFQKACICAKEFPGSVVRRAQDGIGFTVIPPKG